MALMIGHVAGVPLEEAFMSLSGLSVGLITVGVVRRVRALAQRSGRDPDLSARNLGEGDAMLRVDAVPVPVRGPTHARRDLLGLYRLPVGRPDV